MNYWLTISSFSRSNNWSMDCCCTFTFAWWDDGCKFVLLDEFNDAVLLGDDFDCCCCCCWWYIGWCDGCFSVCNLYCIDWTAGNWWGLLLMLLDFVDRGDVLTLPTNESGIEAAEAVNCFCLVGVECCFILFIFIVVFIVLLQVSWLSKK